MAFAALLLAGCASKMEPAQKAVANIEAAIAAAGPDAAKYIPDQLQAVNGKLADLKAKFDQKDYAGVLAAASTLLPDAQGLAAAASSAKESALAALGGEWTTLSGALPAAIAALESRVNILSKSRKLPANLDAASFESVKTGLAEAKSLWDQATASQAAGNVEAAVTAARQVKEKTSAAMTALGMTAS
jgi:hypothetical protein